MGGLASQDINFGQMEKGDFTLNAKVAKVQLMYPLPSKHSCYLANHLIEVLKLLSVQKA